MFDTLIDWAGDLYTEAGDYLSNFFSDVPETPAPETPVPELAAPEAPPVTEAPPVEAPQTFAAGDAIDAGAETALPDALKEGARNSMTTGGLGGFKEWFSALPKQDQALLVRAGFSAAGAGAGAALQGVAQRNRQEFETQQSDRAREDRRGEEDRARDERLNNRSVVARNVSVRPRGIIASGRG